MPATYATKTRGNAQFLICLTQFGPIKPSPLLQYVSGMICTDAWCYVHYDAVRLDTGRIIYRVRELEWMLIICIPSSNQPVFGVATSVCLSFSFSSPLSPSHPTTNIAYYLWRGHFCLSVLLFLFPSLPLPSYHLLSVCCSLKILNSQTFFDGGMPPSSTNVVQLYWVVYIYLEWFSIQRVVRTLVCMTPVWLDSMGRGSQGLYSENLLLQYLIIASQEALLVKVRRSGGLA